MGKATIFAPIAKTFASLCSLLKRTLYISEHRAALIPLCLFAAMEIPIPVPQIKIPRSASPSIILFAALSAKSG